MIAILFSIAFAASKQEIYQTSCEGSYFVALVNISDTPQDKIRKVAKELCKAGVERWDKEKRWSKIDKPMLLGCWNAMEGVYSPDMEPKKRLQKTEELQKKVCANIGDR